MFELGRVVVGSRFFALTGRLVKVAVASLPALGIKTGRFERVELAFHLWENIDGPEGPDRYRASSSDNPPDEPGNWVLFGCRSLEFERAR